MIRDAEIRRGARVAGVDLTAGATLLGCAM